MGLNPRLASVGLAALATAIAFTGSTSASAQVTTSQPESSVSDEPGAVDIVVTARRREERLQEVPISVTAYSGSDLESKSINDIQNVAQATPNINYAAGY